VVELWLVRHGQTDWNRDKRVQGWRDVPLNATGVAQAKELADALRGQSFTHMFTSDLARAVQTAQILRETVQCPLSINPLLRERRFGPLEGNVRMNADMCDNTSECPDFPSIDETVTSEETDEAFSTRARSFLDAVLRAVTHGRVIAVTHGGFIRMTLCILGQVPPSALHNTGVTRVNWDGHGWQVLDVDRAVHRMEDSRTQSAEAHESDLLP
jgi:2,3-bisphosphoglycerate-dependent phosphoglycerate mutase